MKKREELVEEALTRSVVSVLPSEDALKDRMLGGERLRMYIGADATGPQLHIGHATNFLLLERMRQLGNEIIVLFGDFTAMIGDPSDRDAARKPLPRDEVNENIRSWKEQVSKILPFDGDNPARIEKNSAWLSKLKLEDIQALAAHFTVQQMIERDMFAKRIGAGKPVYMHEFLYPLLQGYDSVAMDVDVEVGGTDQTFNMLAGRTLQERMNKREKFVVATALLENPRTGKKLMSKSEGNYIAMNDRPSDMYGKTMALPDEVVPQVFIDCTRVPLDDVKRITSGNPRDAKMRLAREIVMLYHGESESEKAETHFVQTFQKGEIPDDAVEVHMPAGRPDEYLVRADVVSSKSEFQRLLAEGAVVEAETGNRLSGPLFEIKKNCTLKIGKRRFVKIVVT